MEGGRPFGVMKGSLFAGADFHQVAIYGAGPVVIDDPADSRTAGLRSANRVMLKFLGHTNPSLSEFPMP